MILQLTSRISDPKSAETRLISVVQVPYVSRFFSCSYLRHAVWGLGSKYGGVIYNLFISVLFTEKLQAAESIERFEFE